MKLGLALIYFIFGLWLGFLIGHGVFAPRHLEPAEATEMRKEKN